MCDPDTRDFMVLQRLAVEIYEDLARQFPVCMASDEFHFFPQYVAAERDWSRWDDFSAEALQAFAAKAAGWHRQLHTLATRQGVCRCDAALLARVLTTLDEQFNEVQFHQIQPTFYLTVLGIGLAEALEAGTEAVQQRIATVPDFLKHAGAILQPMPRLFRDMGLEMAQRLIDWFAAMKSLTAGSAPEALAAFCAHLQTIAVQEDFLPRPDLYPRIAAEHMGCDMTVEAIADRLQMEIDETTDLMQQAAGQLQPGAGWRQVWAHLPAPGGSAADLYQRSIAELRGHCRQQGFGAGHILDRLNVHIEAIPDYLLPVRSSAAFSMRPEHPPTGGTFYLQTLTGKTRASLDYRLLAAHETFPGHCLLDSHRWNLDNRLRRHLEFPLFYEGWASFAEELLFDTGYFAAPRDRFLIALRRFWRALRGKTDLEIHTGRTTLTAAAAALVAQGLDPSSADRMVRRYALKPGYQLAYTIGRCQFEACYRVFRDRAKTTAEFVRTVLLLGEIDFADLQTAAQDKIGSIWNLKGEIL